ncbi:MAG TPA: magnesium transporter CorA family protein [Methanocorpusculum sp.]|nr:magnesium transporter CorA family protein [Methanocorpusculum sp.]HJJ53408.1 magnesium transporter CorA family protein [Methanocorpusculum sp.]
MIEIYSSLNETGLPIPQEGITKGCWIRLIMPTEEELSFVCDRLSIEKSELTVLLDEEERPRVEHDQDFSLILIDTPYVVSEDDIESYTTIPAGFILLPEVIISVSLRKNPLLDMFSAGKMKNFSTNNHAGFILLFLYKNAGVFVQNLRMIDKRTSEIEKTLKKSTKNEELFHMLTLSKSLVYITNSLKGNAGVLEKLSKSQNVTGTLTEKDRDVLDDAIIENSQAMEMAQTYAETITSTMGAFASIINNNVNWIMKLFTSFAAIMAIPMVVAGFFGMNVAIPMTEYPFAFISIVVGSLGVSAVLIFVMMKKRIL